MGKVSGTVLAQDLCEYALLFWKLLLAKNSFFVIFIFFRQMEPSLKIHELRGETYFGLLRLLKPGFRTVILLVDNESKDTLMPKFFKAVFPYRK